MIDHEKDTRETDTFADTTIKQGNWWTGSAKILPMVALCVITVLHFSDFHLERDLIFNAVVVMFFIFSITWWFWAVQKIISAAKFLNRTQYKFLEITKELQKIKNNFKNNDSDR